MNTNAFATGFKSELLKMASDRPNNFYESLSSHLPAHIKEDLERASVDTEKPDSFKNKVKDVWNRIGPTKATLVSLGGLGLGAGIGTMLARYAEIKGLDKKYVPRDWLGPGLTAAGLLSLALSETIESDKEKYRNERNQHANNRPGAK